MENKKNNKIKNLIISYVNAITVDAERFNIDGTFSEKFSNKIYTIISISFFIKLLFFILLVCVTWSAVNGSKTFIVNAKTEYFEYIPKSLDIPRIYISNGAIINKKNKSVKTGIAPIETRKESPCSIEIHGKSKFIFSRIANGPARISISCKNAVVYDDEEEVDQNYNDDIEIIFSYPSSPGKEFSEWLYHIDGTITLGRTPTLGVTQVSGMLIDGELQTLARKVWTKNPYSIDLMKLKFGDEIRFALNNSPALSSGIVTIDENRGFQIAATSKADSAIVIKPRDTSLIVKNSLWSVLQQDEQLSLSWAGLAFLISVFSFFTKFLFFYKTSQ